MSIITCFVWKISWEEKQNGKKPVQEGQPYIFKAQVEKKMQVPGDMQGCKLCCHDWSRDK